MDENLIPSPTFICTGNGIGQNSSIDSNGANFESRLSDPSLVKDMNRRSTGLSIVELFQTARFMFSAYVFSRAIEGCG